MSLKCDVPSLETRANPRAVWFAVACFFFAIIVGFALLLGAGLIDLGGLTDLELP